MANTMVVGIHHEDITGGIDRYTERKVESSRCACTVLKPLVPASRKRSDFSSAYNYFADTLVALVCNKQITTCVNGYAIREVETADAPVPS